MKEKALELLQELCDAAGAPADEGAVTRVFARELGPDLRCDRSGSVVAEAGAVDRPRVMLTAHLDEVAFAVQSITAGGLLRLMPLGGWWTHVLPAMPVRVVTRDGREVPGVVAAKPVHLLRPEEREKLLSVEDLYVDVGADSADAVRNACGIELGDTIVPTSSFRPLMGGRYAAKALDNRLGVALAVQATLRLRPVSLPHRLLYGWHGAGGDRRARGTDRRPPRRSGRRPGARRQPGRRLPGHPRRCPAGSPGGRTPNPLARPHGHCEPSSR